MGEMGKEGFTIREKGHNLVHLFLKTNFKNSISLVNREHLQVFSNESFGVLFVTSLEYST